ncbi:MAG TPA: asparagine synthase (glutamine-hydrolyzing), partial [Pseudonocardia sp.]|nr:asparagine synthase (glutamine-hydrolyzing) [Pseudonocardia sp.]
MCGIAGEVRFGTAGNAADADPAAVGRMCDTMVPRGPDGSGLFASGRIAFGHRRLKIIDLSERGAQPMVDPELGLTVVFNGCIYNYRELRAELTKAGYRFFSESDTEVIGKAYHRWGTACVEHFYGMFAFAIAERDTGTVVLARDRLGIKPLYLAETPGRLRFASTLPALLAAGEVDTSIDPVALHHYLSFHSVVPAPRTILTGVRKLPPATVRVIDADGTSREHRYWAPSHERRAGDAGMTARDWADEVLATLRRAVQRRMVADVPVGVLLSSGIDSSVIVALLAEQGQHGLRTFSV